MPIAEEKLRQILRALHEQQADAEVQREDRSADSVEQVDLRKFKIWFLQQFAHATTAVNGNSCSLEDFAVYFLRILRQEIELHLRTNDADAEKCQTPVRKVQSSGRRSNLAQRFAQTQDTENAELSWQPESTPATTTNNVSFDASGFAHELSSHSSTPVRRVLLPNMHTPRRSNHNSLHTNSYMSPSHGDTSLNSSAGRQRSTYSNSSTPAAASSFCLGDFLLSSPALNNRMTKKKSQQQHQQHQHQQNSATEKPKKRVPLRTIKRTSLTSMENSFGNASAQSQEQENNTSIAIVSNPATTLSTQEAKDTATSALVPTAPPIDFSTVTQRPLLERLARIHAVLIDLNLCVSVLNEISFLLSLLNNHNVTTQSPYDGAPSERFNQLSIDTEQRDSEVSAALGASYTNCVYFAVCVLRMQRQLLALLDLKSLDAVLQIDNLHQLAQDLRQYLLHALQRKQQLDAQSASYALSRSRRTFKNVYFHEEQNSRQCFPSNHEFGAFKTQRDLFYDALKLWETKHMTPAWNFNKELWPKINEIFRQSENPVNMMHFAKLFVAQLLISALEATSPEEIGLKLDLDKLSKLTQRMILPGTFSIDYQFPRSQAFFRDFILIVKSFSFMEQLKIALYVQLITLNNATIEQQCLYAHDKVEEHDVDAAATQASSTRVHAEYVVRPDVLASMLILAKFLGFVQALPFQAQLAANDAARVILPANIEREQLQLRSRFQPNFNVCELLQAAITGRKLLITLPWLVQYMVMLDNVTLQLADTAAALRVMYALYTELGIAAERHLQLQPITAFIVRCCIGWLCEKRSFIAEQYYAHRATLSAAHSKLNAREPLGECALAALPVEEQLLIETLQLEGSAMGDESYAELNPPTNVLLESLISVACPFMAEFRVAIRPAITTRTGNYRCIVTRMYELPTQTQQINKNISSKDDTSNAQQSKLIEVFLQSQPPSMRTMIEYIIERTYKATVKDAQYQILLPSKSAADADVNKITSANLAVVTEAVDSIYGNAKALALKQWNAQVPKVLAQRINGALDALLPADTLAIVKQTYFQLIERSAMQKIQQWCNENMLQNNFYCSNYYEMVRKICKANSRERVQPHCTELRLLTGNEKLSDLLARFQYQLHSSTMRADLLLTTDEVITLLAELREGFENTLPPLFYHLSSAYVLELMQHLVRDRPAIVNESLVQAACQFWLHAKQKSGSDGAETLNAPNSTPSTQQQPNIFDDLLTQHYIETLHGRTNCFHSLERLLIGMIMQQVISIDYVNVGFMGLYKHEWPAATLNLMSHMLNTVAKETAVMRGKDQDLYGRQAADDAASVPAGEFADIMSQEKSHLIMEVLADFARDIDDY